MRGGMKDLKIAKKKKSKNTIKQRKKMELKRM